jgi:hypothetical protein
MKKSRLLEIIQEEIASALKEVGQSPEEAKATNLAIAAEKAKILASQKHIQNLQKGISEIALEEDQLDEMAKITGRLEAAIKKVMSSNKDLEGLPLKKAIKADAEVEDALEGDTMYDNQLNKFIALVRGEREVGQRGRKADPNKAKAEPKAKAEKAKAEPKAEKASTKDMDDEDKEASKNIGSDATAKELGKSSSRKDKIVKAYQNLKPQLQDKISQSKKGDQEAMNWLKNTWTPILQAYKKAQQVKL